MRNRILLIAMTVIALACACGPIQASQQPSASGTSIADTTVTLPGKGLAQHPFLYCGEWQQRGQSQQTMYVVRGGKVVWTYSIPSGEELGDCTMLSNGNIVFSRRSGASEVTPDKKIVWNFIAPPNTEIHTAYPIGKDRVLLIENGNPAKLFIILKANGEVEKQLILPTGNGSIHGQFRHVRMTKAHTFLVPHMDLGKAVEYDWNGNPIWSVPHLRPGLQSGSIMATLSSAETNTVTSEK